MASVDFEYKTATLDNIEEWCEANNPSWFVSIIETTENINFLTLRRKFFETFAPDKLPKPSKTLTMVERAKRMKEKMAAK
jgi:hypothetical protein